ncbi:UBP1-associated protein 2C [Elaeis guineensis]|uniref:RBP42 n=1 Tax=Elaeis guineensis var. tenera TaxID=51953 RepID=H9AWW7_ELAGV|nr:UBP1-associated protein 2C [Elaeis guineensis]XP_010913180.1 UBP1-associated protein 2C [Elaeis guineensis]XP_010913187.1 UBP1-associated protein 2C [Elaeis guineensis]XP_010913194.1 UBP1-associated protein 2C [Elaeis guineensis]XP_010913202.1 UBP1-associated protein 2C [Elaeis guineensis]AFC89654.1 RBP42 [Elaeis guineensis]
MDPTSKKRKSDENGAVVASPALLTPEDARKIVEPFTREHLLDIVREAMCRDAGVLDAVRAIADRDPAQRKLFIRGLGWETTTESLRNLFSSYGELEEAVVIVDKATGKSKGYGFITFRHIDGALLALKEPSKKIDGRMTVTQLAAAGTTAAAPPAIDVSLRKIYVGNVPADMPSDRLLAHFSSYGEIEEGPLGFDKQTGKFRGFALFVYKTAEGAGASLVDPTKNIDGHHLVCKLAIDGKKVKPGAPAAGAAAPVGGVQGQRMGGGADIGGDGLGMGHQSSLPGSFGGYSGGGIPGAAGLGQHHHPSSIGAGTPGLSSVGSQVPGAGGYGGGLGGPYGASSQYDGPGYGGFGGGSSLYRMPPSSVGMPSGGYPESGHYPLSSSAYQSQHRPPTGSSPGARVPSGGGLYQNPFY